MKKMLAVMMACMLVFSLAACGSDNGGGDGAQVRVALLISGNLGDMSFNDSAYEGMLKAEEDFGIFLRTTECNSDPAKLEPTLIDAAEDGYDIIVGSSNFTDYVMMHADDYPDSVFVIFDDEVDWDAGDLANVHCILYKNNEASFLGGFLAAELTNSGLDGYNDANIIGFLGGMDQPVINDFLVGYIEGAQYSDPDIKVAITYVNSFSDSAKGKELSISMIDQGADISFNVAGGAGIGLIEAASEKNAFVLGVDSDQAMIYEEKRPEFSEIIPSSVLKNVGDTLYRMTGQYLEDSLNVGGTDILGIAEGAVGLADNKYYQANVPEEIREKVKELENVVNSGEIKIGSAYGRPNDEIIELRESVRP